MAEFGNSGLGGDRMTKRPREDQSIAVAFQGNNFSFTHEAAMKIFNKFCVTYSECKKGCNDVFDAVETGSVSYGVMPVESSTRGTLHLVYDRLLASSGRVQIVGEIGIVENYCLAANSTCDSVDEVVGHPHIVESCSEFLDSLDVKRSHNSQQPIIRTAASDRCVKIDT